MSNTTLITDIHTHVLPGIDDGPTDLEEATQLLEAIRNTGVNRVFCTSHYASPNFPVTTDDLMVAYSSLLPRQDLANWPGLSFAAEVRLSPGLETDLRNRSIPTLGSTRYVLIEFPGNDISEANLSLIHELSVRGYLPIMAHPERNLSVQRRPEWLEDLQELGIHFQLTADCFLKSSSDMLNRDKLAWKILEHGQATLVASDTHNISSRAPVLVQAYERIGLKLGQNIVDQLVENSNYVWDNAEIHPVSAAKPRKRVLGLF